MRVLFILIFIFKLNLKKYLCFYFYFQTEINIRDIDFKVNFKDVDFKIEFFKFDFKVNIIIFFEQKEHTMLFRFQPYVTVCTRNSGINVQRVSIAIFILKRRTPK